MYPYSPLVCMVLDSRLPCHISQLTQAMAICRSRRQSNTAHARPGYGADTVPRKEPCEPMPSSHSFHSSHQSHVPLSPNPRDPCHPAMHVARPPGGARPLTARTSRRQDATARLGCRLALSLHEALDLSRYLSLVVDVDWSRERCQPHASLWGFPLSVSFSFFLALPMLLSPTPCLS